MVHADLVIICSGLTLITVPPDVDIGHSSAISQNLSTQKTSSCQLDLMFSIFRVKQLDQMFQLVPQEKIDY